MSDEPIDQDRPADPQAEPAAAPEPSGLELAPEPPPSPELVESLRRERDELRDQVLRRRAEFENYKRRVERERQQQGQEAVADLLKALVPTLDHLDLAVVSEGPEGSLREGLGLIRRGLLGTLEGRGLAVDDPLGQPFDPERHQAVSHEESALPEGQVVRVLARGFAWRERLLRPALVVVSRGSGLQGGDSGTGTAVN